MFTTTSQFFFTFYIFSTNVSKLKFCNLNEVIMLFTKTFDGFVEYICACSRMRAYSKKTRVSVSLWDGLKQGKTNTITSYILVITKH